MDQFNGKKYLHWTDLTVKEARKTLFKSIGMEEEDGTQLGTQLPLRGGGKGAGKFLNTGIGSRKSLEDYRVEGRGSSVKRIRAFT